MQQENSRMELPKSGCAWGTFGGAVFGVALAIMYILIHLNDPTQPNVSSDVAFFADCTLIAIVAIAGTIIGIVLGFVGGFLLEVFADILIHKHTSQILYDWAMGVVTALYGMASMSLLIKWSGILHPCALVLGYPCDRNLLIQGDVFVLYLFVPSSIAAIWSVVWSRRNAQRYRAKVLGVPENV